MRGLYCGLKVGDNMAVENAGLFRESRIVRCSRSFNFFFLGRSPRQDNSDGQREIDYISIGHELLNCVLNVTEWLNVVYIGQLNTLA
jgi:hypothetical protein